MLVERLKVISRFHNEGIDHIFLTFRNILSCVYDFRNQTKSYTSHAWKACAFLFARRPPRWHPFRNLWNFCDLITTLWKTFTRKLLTRRRKYVCQQTIIKDQAKPYGNSRFCQKFCADVISVLGMTMSEGRDCLKFRLQGSHEEIGSWGHEYVRWETIAIRFLRPRIQLIYYNVCTDTWLAKWRPSGRKFRVRMTRCARSWTSWSTRSCRIWWTTTRRRRRAIWWWKSRSWKSSPSSSMRLPSVASASTWKGLNTFSPSRLR